MFETLPYYTQYPFSFVGTGHNPCTSPFTFTFIYGPNCGYFYGPNPANEELVVFRTNPEDTSEGSVEATIELYNDSMKKVFSLLTKNNAIRIPTKDFPEGIYYLHIKTGDKFREEQIIIKR